MFLNLLYQDPGNLQEFWMKGRMNLKAVKKLGSAGIRWMNRGIDYGLNFETM